MLNVYHHRRNAFDEDVTSLLQEMTADISFALDNFDRGAQRARFQKAVRASEALLSTILDNVGACIYLKDLDGRYLFVNQQVLDLWGVELALLRWQHPEIGYTSPARFIPIAEESGLILEIGNWVLRTAIAQQASWRAAGLAIASVAVNLSAVQMYRDDFTEMVCRLLEEYDLPAQMLDLKSFVDGLADDPEDQAIVMAIIGIARGLGFQTVAEGVETLAQWQFLQQYGCDEYKGYYFSRPLPKAELEKLAREQAASETGA